MSKIEDILYKVCINAVDEEDVSKAEQQIKDLVPSVEEIKNKIDLNVWADTCGYEANVEGLDDAAKAIHSLIMEKMFNEMQTP